MIKSRLTVIAIAAGLVLTGSHTAFAESQCDTHGFKAAAPSAAKYDSSNFWKVKSPTGNEGFILGIIHTTEPRALSRYSEAQALSLDADVYFSEVNFESDSVAQLVEAGLGPNRLESLDLAAQEKLSKIAERRRTPIESLKNKKEWYLWSDLSRPLERGYGIDHLFWMQRRAVNKPIVALEEMDHLIQALNDFPDSNSVLMDLICEYEVVERQFTNLKDAFMREDWPAFYEESMRWESRSPGVSARFRDNLILARNHHMVQTMKNTLLPGQSFFVTVGLSHLGGDDGLLDILVKSGYSVTPLTLSQVSAIAGPVRDKVIHDKSEKIRSAIRWLQDNSPYKFGPDRAPNIRFVNHKEMQTAACDHPRCDVSAFLSGDTILVHDSNFTAFINGEMSVFGSIVHELIHWGQKLSVGKEAYCGAWPDMENEAYLIQNQYLAAHGSMIARRKYTPTPPECR